MQQPNHGDAYQSRIDAAGRIVIPEALRKEAGIHEGDTLMSGNCSSDLAAWRWSSVWAWVDGVLVEDLG